MPPYGGILFGEPNSPRGCMIQNKGIERIVNMSYTLIQKLSILSDAAKYDASCASSGTTKRNSADGKGLGSTEGHGICHAYAPDGRCISLLKILMTNFCIYDCVFCVNRASSNVAKLYRGPVFILWHHQVIRPNDGRHGAHRKEPAHGS